LDCEMAQICLAWWRIERYGGVSRLLVGLAETVSFTHGVFPKDNLTGFYLKHDEAGGVIDLISRD
jgi:hypothetical protein